MHNSECKDCAEHDRCEQYLMQPTIEETIDWIFEKFETSVEAELNISQEGPHDGCYVFNGMLKTSLDYKLDVFYKSIDFPTREKALSNALSEFLNKR